MVTQIVRSPQVSILIPVYNRKEFIAECIQSALDQTVSDLEIIIVDNASDDGTWEICQKYASRDQRIRIFRNDENVGPVRNWLACVACATGTYTKILWSDDLIHPKFLEKTLPFFTDPSVGFVYSSARVFSEKKVKFEAICPSINTANVFDAYKYIFGVLLLEGDFPVSPGCAIFRTEDVRQNLLLHVPNRVGSDFSRHAIGNDLLLFLLTANKYQNYAFVSEPLSYFRVHEGSITVAASYGKLFLHYDLAKGYFAENYLTDISLLKKFNAVLTFHLFRYVAKEFGINSLEDFYPTKRSAGIDFIYLLKICTRRLFKKLQHS
jgi:glycosyltransferase involved in cell wall biosynthesis